MIITESGKILTDTLLGKSKLMNMKDHLETLLRKKIRLESEITLLKKQIKQKSQSFEMNIKTKLALESTEVISDSDQKIIQESFPELHQAFLEFDDLTKEIQELLQRFEES